MVCSGQISIIQSLRTIKEAVTDQILPLTPGFDYFWLEFFTRHFRDEKMDLFFHLTRLKGKIQNSLLLSSPPEELKMPTIKSTTFATRIQPYHDLLTLLSPLQRAFIYCNASLCLATAQAVSIPSECMMSTAIEVQIHCGCTEKVQGVSE